MGSSLLLIKFFICIMQSFLVASSLFNLSAAADAVSSGPTGFPDVQTVGEDACDFETGGSACCNGKGLAVIGTKDYCLDLVKYGECAATQHACYATRLNKNFVGYCCENPKGPHKFPKGHPKLSAEQNEKTQKANDAAEKAADSESTEFGVASKAGEDACDFETGGSACCNGKGLA